MRTHSIVVFGSFARYNRLKIKQLEKFSLPIFYGRGQNLILGEKRGKQTLSCVPFLLFLKRNKNKLVNIKQTLLLVIAFVFFLR